jgi:chloramphenicol-sensitive protein RarD
MFIETVFLIPPAIGYLFWMYGNGQPIFFGGGAVNVGLALLAGVITVVPLLLYHAGNRDLPIIVAGLLFYANPTTQMLIGIYHFRVPFTMGEATTFALIWCGLALYFWTRRDGRQPAG